MANEQEPEERRRRQEGGPEEGRPERPQRGLFMAVLLLGLVLLLLFGSKDGGVGALGQKPLELIEFERLLQLNAVEEVRFKENQALVVLRGGDLAGDYEALSHTIYFNSPEAALRIEELISRLAEDKGITTAVHTEHSNALFYQLLVWLLPTLLLIGVLYFFLFRQLRGPGGPGSLINFGKSRHRIASDKPTVTLKDVAGIDEARQDIEEVISFLKAPQKFTRLGGRMPKGVLLVGPPGTGKTLLAKATAGEAGVSFFSVSGSDFVEMFVGVGASRVRDLFEKAKESSPCIIFLDEVDAVGRRRGSGMGGGHDEREQTLNQILVEMDGFDTDRGIIVMAATNRPDILDPALLRPGRFDRQIVIDMPNVDAREKILRVHARDKKLALDVDMRRLARATPTFSGAELEALLNEAALAAAMEGLEAITMEIMEDARDRIRWGRAKKSWKMVEEEVRATAYHEGGHALVAALVEGCDPLHKVTVVPRGRALGVTMSLPERDTYSLTRKKILARIAMAFGGRIGEAIYTDDLSTGASNDIQQATEMARRYVTEWGMSEALGPVRYATDEGDTVFLGREMSRARETSEETMQTIDREVRRVIDEAYKRAEDVIETHRSALDRIAEALMRYETLSGEEIKALIEDRAIRQSPPGPAAAPLASPAETASPGASDASSASDADAAPGGPGGAAAEEPSEALLGAGAPAEAGAASERGALDPSQPQPSESAPGAQPPGDPAERPA